MNDLVDCARSLFSLFFFFSCSLARSLSVPPSLSLCLSICLCAYVCLPHAYLTYVYLVWFYSFDSLPQWRTRRQFTYGLPVRTHPRTSDRYLFIEAYFIPLRLTPAYCKER
ncbi:hypothetical protein PUN28_010190 [Cardiocondyla obscurior]|uniref:Secreted protein n=1 Tax=Cardiocondyla obscurior TaxID=286306 RepID=A0AAW2FR09_9HYME